MAKYWIGIIIAACFEVGWVIGLKHAATPFEWGATVICIIVSFTVLIKASNHLPV